MDINIREIPADQLKEGVKQGQELEFGKEFTNRMFQMKYSGGAWTNADAG